MLNVNVHMHKNMCLMRQISFTKGNLNMDLTNKKDLHSHDGNSVRTLYSKEAGFHAIAVLSPLAYY